MQSVTIADEQQSMAEGDLDRLDFRPRISLALLLDTPSEGHDWRALAHQLHLQHLISGLQSMTSPTKELLNMLEVSLVPRPSERRSGTHCIMLARFNLAFS